MQLKFDCDTPRQLGGTDLRMGQCVELVKCRQGEGTLGDLFIVSCQQAINLKTGTYRNLKDSPMDGYILRPDVFVQAGKKSDV